MVSSMGVIAGWPLSVVRGCFCVFFCRSQSVRTGPRLVFRWPVAREQVSELSSERDVCFIDLCSR